MCNNEVKCSNSVAWAIENDMLSRSGQRWDDWSQEALGGEGATCPKWLAHDDAMYQVALGSDGETCPKSLWAVQS